MSPEIVLFHENTRNIYRRHCRIGNVKPKTKFVWYMPDPYEQFRARQREEIISTPNFEPIVYAPWYENLLRLFRL